MKFIAVITAWHVDLKASIVKEIQAANKDEAVGIAHGMASLRAFCCSSVRVGTLSAASCLVFFLSNGHMGAPRVCWGWCPVNAG